MIIVHVSCHVQRLKHCFSFFVESEYRYATIIYINWTEPEPANKALISWKYAAKKCYCCIKLILKHGGNRASIKCLNEATLNLIPKNSPNTEGSLCLKQGYWSYFKTSTYLSGLSPTAVQINALNIDLCVMTKKFSPWRKYFQVSRLNISWKLIRYTHQKQSYSQTKTIFPSKLL